MLAGISLALRGGLVGLAAVALLAEGVALAQSPRLNLIAVGVAAPAEAVSGASIAFTATFASQSTAAPPRFFWSVYLTQHGVLGGATLVRRLGPVTLGATETREIDATATLPAGVAGQYALAVVADVDADVAELDELDNAAFAPQPTRVRAPSPDVVAISATAREASLREGEPLHIEFTLENTGERPATVTVAGHLSRDPSLSTRDPLVGSIEVSVPAGESVSRAITGVVPAGTRTGDYTVGVIVDPDGAVAELSETNNVASTEGGLNVRRDTLALSTAALTDGALGVAYHLQLESEGGDGHFAYAVASGALPAGLALDPDTGAIDGLPTESGTATVAIAVTSAGLRDERGYSILIHGPGTALAIASSQVEDGALGLPYEQHLVAAGGEPPYDWTLASGGGLPPGLELKSDGMLTGLPTMLGDFAFEVAVTDHLGTRVTADVSMKVAPPVNVLILLRDPPPAPVGRPLDFALEVTGGVPPYRWEALSTTPPGLAITEQGHLAGTPTKVGRFAVRVRATDSTRASNDDTALVFVDVEDDGALAIQTAALPSVQVRTAYEAALEASGGTPPYAWRLAPGDHLPGGFFLVQGDGMTHPADTALIRGVTVYPGATPFSIEVEDAEGRRAARVMLLDVEVPAETTQSGCACLVGRGGAGASFLIAGLALLALARRRR